MEGDDVSDHNRDLEALSLFRRRFGIEAGGHPVAALARVARAFARLPYENLSKIIRAEEEGEPSRARRGPIEVIEGHARDGTGGTCFSLAACLLSLARALGLEARPLLADRRYGAETHCALLLELDGRRALLDPGYLISRPVPLDEPGERRVETPFNTQVLRTRPGDGGGGDAGRVAGVDLFTVEEGRETYRLTYHAAPADEASFRRAWERSFDQEMMRVPVLTGVRSGRQVYLQGTRWQSRRRDRIERRELPPGQLAARIAREFGLRPRVVERALSILERRGETLAGAPLPRVSPGGSSAGEGGARGHSERR